VAFDDGAALDSIRQVCDHHPDVIAPNGSEGAA
jgi:hypothetical protein